MDNVLTNRQIVLNTLKASNVPMSLRDVQAASGLRRLVVTGALYRLRDKGCVEVKLTQAGYSAFVATGERDNSPTHLRSPGRSGRRKKKLDKDALGVELVVRVLDGDGKLIELSLAQAMEVERQLANLRQTMAAVAAK